MSTRGTVDAIESFFVQNNFCNSDISGSERQAHLLSQFCDYVLVENASRWRGMEPFLDTRALRNTWSDFIRGPTTSVRGPATSSTVSTLLTRAPPTSSSSSGSLLFSPVRGTTWIPASSRRISASCSTWGSV